MTTHTRNAIAADLIADFERRRRTAEQQPYAIATESFTYQEAAVRLRPTAFKIVGGSAQRGRGSRPNLNAAAATPAPPKRRAQPQRRDDGMPSWYLGPRATASDRPFGASVLVRSRISSSSS